MLLLVAIIVWAVAVGGCLAYAAVCGVRTFRRVRAAQATLEGRIAALQAEGVGGLEQKTAERLEHSMAGLRVLTGSVSTAATVLLAARRVVRR